MCQSTEVDSEYTLGDLDIFLVRLHRGVPVRGVLPEVHAVLLESGTVRTSVSLAAWQPLSGVFVTQSLQ